MTPRDLGMLAAVSMCVAFVACETQTIVEPFPTSGPGSGGNGGTGAPAHMGGKGGIGGIGGDGGDGASGVVGGMGGEGGDSACNAPAVSGVIEFSCGGSVTTSTGSGTTDCQSCIVDSGSNEYTVVCSGSLCECKYNDSTVCTCMNDNTQTCDDSCCPSPWGDTPQGGGGGAGGVFSVSTTSTANGGAGGVPNSTSSAGGSGGVMSTSSGLGGVANPNGSVSSVTSTGAN